MALPKIHSKVVDKRDKFCRSDAPSLSSSNFMQPETSGSDTEQDSTAARPDHTH